MLEQLKKIMDILSAHEKRRFFFLVGLMVVTAFSEILGLSVFLALLGLLSQPEMIANNSLLDWAYNAFEFDSLFVFQVAVALIAATVIMLGLVFKAVSGYIVSRFAIMTGYKLSLRMLKAYLRQPYSWSIERNSVDMGRTILAECGQFVKGVVSPSLEILASCILSISIVGFLISVDPFIALTSFALLAGGYSSIYLLVRNKMQRNGAELIKANREKFRITQEAMGALKEIKLAGLEDVYAAQFDTPSLRSTRYATSAMVLFSIPRYVLEGLTFIILLAMVFIVMVRNDGNMLAAIPTLGIFAFSVMRILPALQKVYFGFSALRTGISVVDLIHKDYCVLNVGNDQMEAIDRTSRHTFRDVLAFDDVSYTYPTAKKPALSNLSAEIKANSIIGIVGSTGAGKTTFVDLLLGLLEPDRGNITIDGVPITSANRRAWQNTVGYVPQSIFMANSSVAANIAFGVPKDEIDMDAVKRAAKTAMLHDFIMSELPEGYDTSVGDRGVRLSGGQRQRVGIARALYYDPSLLILDEATSALDNTTERAVMAEIQKLQKEKTIVMIAHRLSTIENCDRIFLLDQGSIAATGTYADLAAINPIFQEMLGKKILRAS